MISDTDSDPYETILMLAMPIDVDDLCAITKAIEPPLKEAGWSNLIIATGGRIRAIPPDERSPRSKPIDFVEPRLNSCVSPFAKQHRQEGTRGFNDPDGETEDYRG